MKQKKTFIQFIKFGLVGIGNTLVSYTVYSLCYYLLHANVHVCNIMGFILSVLFAYVMQSRFVFKENEDAEHRVWWKVLMKTYVSYAFTGLILTEVLLVLWLDVINISTYLKPISEWLLSKGMNMSPQNLAVSIAPFINLIFTIPINFIINKFWAYRH
ncbi:MAG: GtrA family protein [Eubacteriales bacterium]|nr:GtrA family protein [Eubacteriales bacterium]